jgi:hypothetical protein
VYLLFAVAAAVAAAGDAHMCLLLTRPLSYMALLPAEGFLTFRKPVM